MESARVAQPWWPAMVDPCPETGEIYFLDDFEGTSSLWTPFLDSPPIRWILDLFSDEKTDSGRGRRNFNRMSALELCDFDDIATSIVLDPFLGFTSHKMNPRSRLLKRINNDLKSMVEQFKGDRNYLAAYKKILNMRRLCHISEKLKFRKLEQHPVPSTPIGSVPASQGFLPDSFVPHTSSQSGMLPTESSTGYHPIYNTQTNVILCQAGMARSFLALIRRPWTSLKINYFSNEADGRGMYATGVTQNSDENEERRKAMEYIKQCLQFFSHSVSENSIETSHLAAEINHGITLPNGNNEQVERSSSSSNDSFFHIWMITHGATSSNTGRNKYFYSLLIYIRIGGRTVRPRYRIRLRLMYSRVRDPSPPLGHTSGITPSHASPVPVPTQDDSSKADSSKKPPSKEQSLAESPFKKPPIPRLRSVNKQLTRGKYMRDPQLKKRLYLLCKCLMDIVYEDGRQPILMFMESKTLYRNHYTDIEKPVDMVLIEKNIKTEKYQSEEEVLTDFMVMFADCRKYNKVGSTIYEDATRLENVLMDNVKELGPLPARTPEKKKLTRSTVAKKALESLVIDTPGHPVSDFEDPGSQLSPIPSTSANGNNSEPSYSSCTENDFAFCVDGFHGLQSVGGEKELLLDTTGTTSEIFFSLLSQLPERVSTAMSNEDALLLFLMKMKLGLSFKCLGVLFNVLPPTPKSIFVALLEVLYKKTARFVFWPSNYGHLSENMPAAIKVNYANTRVIIGCIELKLETITNQTSITLFKFLIAVSPTGFICFRSKCYDESCLETFIVNDCGVLTFLEKGDVVLADEGFSALDVLESDAIFIIPPAQHDGSHSAEEDASTRVKRCLQLVQTFKILNSIPVELVTYVNQIVHVSCALVNLLAVD